MTGVDGWKLRGPVRALRQEFAEWDAHSADWQPARGLTIVTFRPDGQLAESEHHNPDGSVVRRARVYDEGGRVAEEWWLADGVLTSGTRHAYDSAGRPLSVTEVRADGTERESERCDYDEQGRKRKVIHLTVPEEAAASCSAQGCAAVFYGVEGSEGGYGAPGGTTSWISYDDRGLPLEAIFSDARGRLLRHIVFTRDDRGRVLSEVVEFPGTSTLFGSEMAAAVPVNERARLGELLGAVFEGHTFSSTSFTYDEKGRLVERVLRMGRLSEARTTFGYDDRDDPIEEIQEDWSHSMAIEGEVVTTRDERHHVHRTRFEYRYDPHGNWTERVVWHRTEPAAEYQPSNIERRTLTYHGE